MLSMLNLDKKGNALAVVAIVLALLVLVIYLVNIAQRECNSNRDCQNNEYCNTNYECIEYPNDVVREGNYSLTALILGISGIIIMYIYKVGKLPLMRKKAE